MDKKRQIQKQEFFKTIKEIFKKLAELSQYEHTFDELADDINGNELNMTFYNFETNIMNAFEAILNLRLGNNYIFNIRRIDIPSHHYTAFVITYEMDYISIDKKIKVKSPRPEGRGFCLFSVHYFTDS